MWLPIEELIQKRQSEYYDRLGIADKEGDSACFVELMLEIICDTLGEMIIVGNMTDQDTDQDNIYVKKLLEALGEETKQ